MSPNLLGEMNLTIGEFAPNIYLLGWQQKYTMNLYFFVGPFAPPEIRLKKNLYRENPGSQADHEK